MSQAASRQMAKNLESFHDLQSKIATTTAQLRQWRDLTSETTEKLRVSQADVAQHWTLRKSARESMNAQATSSTESQERLAAKSAE